ncbi:hypothetical protein JCM16138_02690 [Thermococcus atlanticus]
MAMRENMLIFLAIWIILAALLSSSLSIFLTVSLIGILIVLEIGDFYLSKETKEMLKMSSYFLLLIFAFIVAQKVYEVIKG